MQEGIDPRIVERLLAEPTGTPGGFRRFSRSSAAIASLLWIVIIFIADRASKIWMMQEAITQPSGPFPNIVAFTHHQNYGVIANAPIPQSIIVAVTGIILVFVIQALIVAIRAGRSRSAAALGILLGGAAGNLYDRVTAGFVFDWILLFGRSAINLADVAIIIGAGWCVWEMRRKK